MYSLGRLAADRPFLAPLALDHLADMFNDEIESVVSYPYSFILISIAFILQSLYHQYSVSGST